MQHPTFTLFYFICGVWLLLISSNKKSNPKFLLRTFSPSTLYVLTFLHWFYVQAWRKKSFLSSLLTLHLWFTTSLHLPRFKKHHSPLFSLKFASFCVKRNTVSITWTLLLMKSHRSRLGPAALWFNFIPHSKITKNQRSPAVVITHPGHNFMLEINLFTSEAFNLLCQMWFVSRVKWTVKYLSSFFPPAQFRTRNTSFPSVSQLWTLAGTLASPASNLGLAGAGRRRARSTNCMHANACDASFCDYIGYL